MKKDKKKDKKKKKYMGGGMMPMGGMGYMGGGMPKMNYMGGGMTSMSPMGYKDGSEFKLKPGPSVEGMDVDKNVKKPTQTMRGVGAATKGVKFFG